jgi:predicted DCC family thiol-disulfide oxidoreductase YuxK
VSDGARAAAAEPAIEPGDDRPIVLYDGWCNLCDSSVAFILRRDRRARFRFAALQSAAGLAARRRCGEDGLFDETLIVVWRSKCQTRSNALLTILGQLPTPWPALRVFRLVPRPVRDRLYDIVSRNRTRWFGRNQACVTTHPGFADRFLDSTPGSPSSATAHPAHRDLLRDGTRYGAGRKGMDEGIARPNVS